jgi:hypothetical protein
LGAGTAEISTKTNNSSKKISLLVLGFFLDQLCKQETRPERNHKGKRREGLTVDSQQSEMLHLLILAACLCMVICAGGRTLLPRLEAFPLMHLKNKGMKLPEMQVFAPYFLYGGTQYR